MLEHLHLEAETEKPRGVGEGTAKEEKGIKEEGKRENIQPSQKEGKRLNYKNSSSKETALLIKCIRIRLIVGTFPVVQWLKLHTPNTGSPVHSQELDPTCRN